jgi:hypothetical protein
MPHISDLTPKPGERAAIFGGTRAGKSAFQEWSLRTVQEERASAMQILVDTKPRFRAETIKGLRPTWRKDASKLYESWTSGPTIPNSVAIDLWSEKPFKGTFEKPGEIVILQSGEERDWKRMLQLLDGFVKANIKGRERRLIFDECLDFTSATPTVSTLVTMSSTGPHVQVVNAILASILAHIRFRVCPDLFVRCSPGSRSFIYVMMPPI